MGLRIFPGGPYPDAGYGDKAENVSNQLGAWGKDLLGGAFGGSGSTAGVPNSIFSGYGSVLGKLADTAGGTGADPYALQKPEQALLNEQTGNQQTVQMRALAHAKNILAQQGHQPGSPIYEATIRQLQDAASNTNQQNTTSFVVGQRQANLQNLSNLLGQYANAIGVGSGLMGQQIQGYRDQAAGARADTAAGNAAAMNTLGLALGLPPVQNWLFGSGAGKGNTGGDGSSNSNGVGYNKGAGTNPMSAFGANTSWIPWMTKTPVYM